MYVLIYVADLWMNNAVRLNHLERREGTQVTQTSPISDYMV